MSTESFSTGIFSISPNLNSTLLKPYLLARAVEINGKKIEVDKLVDYPLCNDSWRGIVYVGCEAQIAEAEDDPNDNPLFFRGCDLKIEPGTVVYVAAHNDTPYYKGCSCHTGEIPE